MGRSRRATCPKLKVIRYLLLCTFCTILFINGQGLLFRQHGGNEVELLRQMIADQDRNSSMVDVGDDPFAALRAIFNAIPLHNDSAIKPLTIEHFVRRKGSTTIAKNDIVLATHLSTEKFQNLVAQLKHWNGPASVAVFIRSAEDIDLLYKATEENQKNFRETSFHLVLERSFELPYPGNILRQVALGGVESHYFLALDVDHVPMPHDCHNKLLASVLPKISNASKHDTLFVVPAFSASEKLPLSKQDVLKLEKERKIDQLEKLSSPESHGPTKYQTWLESTETSGATYSISITSDQSMEYHPYVLGFKPGIPRYREDFRGYGPNGNGFFRDCYLAGYKHAVLNDFYCVRMQRLLF